MSPLDIALAQQGDRPAQARIVTALIPTARHWARKLAYNEAEDAQQTASLAVFDALRTFDATRGPFRAHVVMWMRSRIAQHHFRKFATTDREFVDAAPLADEAVDVKMSREAITRALNELSARDAFIVRCVMEGLMFEEIGRLAGFSKQRAHQRWKDIVPKVKRALWRNGVTA